MSLEKQFEAEDAIRKKIDDLIPVAHRLQRVAGAHYALFNDDLADNFRKLAEELLEIHDFVGKQVLAISDASLAHTRENSANVIRAVLAGTQMEKQNAKTEV